MWQLTAGSACILATLLAGCSQPTEVTVKEESAGLHWPSGIAQVMRPTVTIQELSPEQQNDTVQIEGQVVRQAPLLEGALYQLQDDGGTIWVFTPAAPPAESALVRVVGTVQVEPISVGGIDISDYYLQESDREVLSENAAPAESGEPEAIAEPTDTAPADNNPE